MILEVLEDILKALGKKPESLSRTALEMLAMDGYHPHRLSEGQVRRLLGFVHSRPDWLRVCAPVMAILVAAREEGLDEGAREAIALAEAIGSGVLLLVDEEKGRAAAQKLIDLPRLTQTCRQASGSRCRQTASDLTGRGCITRVLCSFRPRIGNRDGRAGRR